MDPDHAFYLLKIYPTAYRSISLLSSSHLNFRILLVSAIFRFSRQIRARFEMLPCIFLVYSHSLLLSWVWNFPPREHTWLLLYLHVFFGIRCFPLFAVSLLQVWFLSCLPLTFYIPGMFRQVSHNDGNLGNIHLWSLHMICGTIGNKYHWISTASLSLVHRNSAQCFFFTAMHGYFAGSRLPNLISL